MAIDQPNQVWAADITYIPMVLGFFYLVLVMDCYRRYVLFWCLSNAMDISSYLDALEDTLRKGRPTIFNTSKRAIHQCSVHRQVGSRQRADQHRPARAGWTMFSSSGYGVA